MKILLINGSPKGKKSNTYRLSQAFGEGISENTDTEYEEICVRDKDIKPCSGCFSCWNKTPGKCIINDDMGEILEKILWADTVIWSFGLYYYNVPGKLKMLIDRQLPHVMPFMVKDSESGGHNSRYDMSGKRHVVISTCGFYTAKGNYSSVDEMFGHFLGKDRYERIYCGQGELFRVPELKERTEEYLGYVRRAGKEFSHGKISEETAKELEALLFPKAVFEGMADASWGIEEKTGNKSDEAFIFTKQMAALYNKSSYCGKDIVLEMFYTDEGKRYQIILGKDKSEVIKENLREYTTKIETPLSLWKDIAQGKISGTQAMMEKRYRVSGDFELMLHWDKYFGYGSGSDEKHTDSPHKSEKKSNMLVLLLPWIVFWVAVSIESYAGALISVSGCAAASIIFFRNRKTPYDVISHSAVMILSVLVLWSGNSSVILPVSYLIFGLMWFISCFTKIPLTAHYSMNEYGKDKALENPLFLRTNLILTLAWGILYIATSIWTFFLTASPAAPYIAIINNICPVVMGVFTAWFQRWYPPHYASK